ncbi:SMI1/KNR4 family protein [Gottfriedia acidiceleris]|uniref:SMI1/KNR4 family protein n=1 Tax=Gottfriedia acidiceleris TaxID=371036 RepID=UPI00101CDB40|nr:SMI1/KNR4 family protein [Gottfriedia acidiceleris]
MVKNELYESALEMIKRSKISARVASVTEINLLRDELGGNLPDWLINLMSQLPICSSNLVVPFAVEDEEFELLIDFLDPKELIEENKSLVPGCAVFNRGYLCIGVESGIGNPYAINISEGNNPPVYLLDHEYGEDTEQIIKNKEIIVERLSDLFSIAIIDED